MRHSGVLAARDALVYRYLHLLGISGSPTGLEGLCALVRRHLIRVPFENVSKLMLYDREGAGRPVTIPEFLDGIEHQDLGGTCYSSNPFLAELLQALGYDAVLLAADMSEPDVHTSIRVRVDGRDYHVDVGYAAPLFEPIPIDALPYELSFGHDRYVLDRTAPGYELTLYTNGERRHGYVVHEPPRATAYFHQTILKSFEPARTFMRCLRITRFIDSGGAIELRNRRLLQISGDSSTERQITSLEDLRQVVTRHFDMPRCPIERAVGVLERLNGTPFFGAERWLDSTEEPD